MPPSAELTPFAARTILAGGAVEDCRLAVRLAGLSGQRALRAPVLARLSDDNSALRLEAVQALARLDPKPEEITPLLRDP